MHEFEELTCLPGTDRERRWLEERMTTLSEKEKEITGAISISCQPTTMAEAINHLLSMEEYQICFPAGSYAQLGEFYLRHESSVPDTAIPYADLDKLGTMYEDRHPGLFVGNCFVVYPTAPLIPHYTGQEAIIPEDTGWSVKVKLASPAVPDGVWLRLPDYSRANDGKPDEVALALQALKVRSLDACTLLDAQCILLEAGNLMEQYDNAVDLVNDGNDLGYVLDEQGQGMPHFMERFAAALEYEDCRDLRHALDISQNLHCYEWVACGGLLDFGKKTLREQGVPEELLDSGCIDLESYASGLLEEAGYVLTGDESAYIARNSRKFIYERSTPREAGMTMQQ
nr:hypothetical protein [uncultured Oscillibacter sp.]